MKLLRIRAEGLPLFAGEVDLIFYAQQRVAADDREQLHRLFSNVYLNPVSSFIGINASGKTSVLKLILTVLEILNNEPINHIETREILGVENRVELNTWFWVDSTRELYHLETVIYGERQESGEIRYRIESERLWSRASSEVSTRKSMLEFGSRAPIMVRDQKQEFLSDDVSIMIALNRKTQERVRVVSLLPYTNTNILPFSRDVPAEIIQFLDPTIEYLHIEERKGKRLIRLKFMEKEEMILDDPVQLNQYLSSGTVKGMITFTMAENILKTGGIMVIDEIENHFNEEIAMTLIRFFMDSKLNCRGGSLIFSTHYSELLDEFDRNDCIYITRNRNGITADNLTSLLKRNDIKKSDAYQSGFLEGTTPAYDAYMRLKKSMAASME